MSVRIRVSATFDAPPSIVWDAIEHIETHTEWMADAVSITFRSKQRRGVGTEFECLTRVGPFFTHDVLTVTMWSPRKVMGIEHRGVVTGSGQFTLRRARGGRTRFRWSERLSFPWWMGGFVGERVSKPMLRHIWKKNLARLGARFEAGGG